MAKPQGDPQKAAQYVRMSTDRQDLSLRKYDLGFVPMLPAQWAAIEGLHEVTEGGAYA